MNSMQKHCSQIEYLCFGCLQLSSQWLYSDLHCRYGCTPPHVVLLRDCLSGTEGCLLSVTDGVQETVLLFVIQVCSRGTQAMQSALHASWARFAKFPSFQVAFEITVCYDHFSRLDTFTVSFDCCAPGPLVEDLIHFCFVDTVFV